MNNGIQFIPSLSINILLPTLFDTANYRVILTDPVSLTRPNRHPKHLVLGHLAPTDPHLRLSESPDDSHYHKTGTPDEIAGRLILPVSSYRYTVPTKIAGLTTTQVMRL